MFDQEMLIDILRRHKGSNNPITSWEIAIALGIVDSVATPNTRTLIRELIFAKGLPVGATAKGYFWLETEEELNEYIDQLNYRIRGIRNRIQAVVTNFYKEKDDFV